MQIPASFDGKPADLLISIERCATILTAAEHTRTSSSPFKGFWRGKGSINPLWEWQTLGSKEIVRTGTPDYASFHAGGTIQALGQLYTRSPRRRHYNERMSCIRLTISKVRNGGH